MQPVVGLAYLPIVGPITRFPRTAVSSPHLRSTARDSSTPGSARTTPNCLPPLFPLAPSVPPMPDRNAVLLLAHAPVDLPTVRPFPLHLPLVSKPGTILSLSEKQDGR